MSEPRVGQNTDDRSGLEWFLKCQGWAQDASFCFGCLPWNTTLNSFNLIRINVSSYVLPLLPQTVSLSWTVCSWSSPLSLAPLRTGWVTGCYTAFWLPDHPQTNEPWMIGVRGTWSRRVRHLNSNLRRCSILLWHSVAPKDRILHTTAAAIPSEGCVTVNMLRLQFQTAEKMALSR